MHQEETQAADLQAMNEGGAVGGERGDPPQGPAHSETRDQAIWRLSTHYQTDASPIAIIPLNAAIAYFAIPGASLIALIGFFIKFKNKKYANRVVADFCLNLCEITRNRCSFALTDRLSSGWGRYGKYTIWGATCADYRRLTENDGGAECLKIVDGAMPGPEMYPARPGQLEYQNVSGIYCRDYEFGIISPDDFYPVAEIEASCCPARDNFNLTMLGERHALVDSLSSLFVAAALLLYAIFNYLCVSRRVRHSQEAVLNEIGPRTATMQELSGDRYTLNFPTIIVTRQQIIAQLLAELPYRREELDLEPIVKQFTSVNGNSNKIKFFDLSSISESEALLIHFNQKDENSPLRPLQNP